MTAAPIPAAPAGTIAAPSDPAASRLGAIEHIVVVMLCAMPGCLAGIRDRGREYSICPLLPILLE